MDMTPDGQAESASEIIASQQVVIAEQAKLIEVLTRRLTVRADISFVPLPAPWLNGLTRAQAAMLLLLRDAYPRILTRDFLLDHVPGRDDRTDRAMDEVVKQCRRRKGADCIIGEYGLGYRMGEAFYKSITQPPAAAP